MTTYELDAKKSAAMRFLDQLLRNQTESVSAVWMYALLGIEQPFPEWILERLEFNGWRSPDDYIRVGNDVHFSPLAAVLVFTSGGSPVAAHVQVKYCQMISKALAGRDIFEVMETAVKSETAKEFLQKELDPERCQ